MSQRDPTDPRPERRGDAPSLFDRLRSLFGGGNASIRDEIEDALDEPDPDAVFSLQERTMLRNVLDLHEIRVEDVMVPRADIIAVGDGARLQDVLAVFREASHSRLPVHGETLDDPKGMVHIRDFVDVIIAPAEGATQLIDMKRRLADAGIVRPVLFVPPSMPALDLLVRMQATRTHMALVIDEYGGTDGIVTIEDIMEVIVGDIEDEHDDAERPAVQREPEGRFLADARADLDDAAAAVGGPIATADEAEEIDTLGGLVVALAGKVPAVGAVVSGDGPFAFEVLDADPRRVKQVRLHPKPSAAVALEAGLHDLQAPS